MNTHTHTQGKHSKLPETESKNDISTNIQNTLIETHVIKSEHSTPETKTHAHTHSHTFVYLLHLNKVNHSETIIIQNTTSINKNIQSILISTNKYIYSFIIYRNIYIYKYIYTAWESEDRVRMSVDIRH